MARRPKSIAVQKSSLGVSQRPGALDFSELLEVPAFLGFLIGPRHQFCGGVTAVEDFLCVDSHRRGGQKNSGAALRGRKKFSSLPLSGAARQKEQIFAPVLF